MIIYYACASDTSARNIPGQNISSIKYAITTTTPIKQTAKVTRMRFDTIFEHAPFSIQVFSPEGETILANRAWMELWRISLERIKGYNILRDPQLVEKGVMSYIQRAFSGEATVVPAIWYDAERVDPDCVPPRWVRAFIYPIMDGARIT